MALLTAFDKKKAVPGGTAKFRKETSKKADSATRVALLRCTTQETPRRCASGISQRSIDWAGQVAYWRVAAAPRAEFREKRPHPAIKSGVFLFGHQFFFPPRGFPKLKAGERLPLSSTCPTRPEAIRRLLEQVLGGKTR